MKQNLLLLLCAITLAFSACDKDHDGVEISTGKSNQAKFTGVVNSGSQTRLSDDKWGEGDAIGIYAFLSPEEEEGEYSDIFDGNANLKFVTSDGEGNFTSTSGEIYFPTEGTLDFIAYYPYKKDINNNTYPIDISNQSNFGDIDLLYSNNATGVSNEEANDITLEFNHILSKLRIEISSGANIESLEGLSVSIAGVVIEGTFNLLSKEIGLNDESKGDIKPIIKAEGEKQIITALLIPGQDLANTTITFNVAGHTIPWTPSEKILESGKEHQYKIKLSATDATVIGSATINGWKPEEEGDIDITIKPDKGDSGDGGDEGEGDGDGDNNGGEITEADESKLLFENANFSDTKYNFKKIIDVSARIESNCGVNSSNGLKIGGGNGKYSLNNFIALVDANKLNGDYSTISFYIKGDFSKSATIAIMDSKQHDNPRFQRYYNLGGVTESKTIQSSDNTDYTGSINTNGEWVKIILDISDIYDDTEERDSFGIYIPDILQRDGYFVIDEITIE